MSVWLPIRRGYRMCWRCWRTSRLRHGPDGETSLDHLCIRSATFVLQPSYSRRAHLPRACEAFSLEVGLGNGSMILLDLMGGVALLLWGLHMVRSGIVRAFGSDLRRFLGLALRNRFLAFLAEFS